MYLPRSYHVKRLKLFIDEIDKKKKVDVTHLLLFLNNVRVLIEDGCCVIQLDDVLRGVKKFLSYL